MQQDKPKSDWNINRTNDTRSYMKVGGGTVDVKGTWHVRMKDRVKPVMEKSRKEGLWERLKKLISGVRNTNQNETKENEYFTR